MSNYKHSGNEYTDKQDYIDKYLASHINDLQDEVDYIEGLLTSGSQFHMLLADENGKVIWSSGSYFPVTPSGSPTSDYQVANKKYVDNFSKIFPEKITRVERTSYQTIGNSWELINWDNEVIDTANAWNVASGSAITVPSDTIYAKIKFYTVWENSSIGDRLMTIRKNNDTIQVGMITAKNESGNFIDTGWISVSEGDIFSFYCYSYTGVDLNGPGFGGPSFAEVIFY